jgi:phosphoglycolate phosphatase-like HAD superfamily hydrolase
MRERKYIMRNSNDKYTIVTDCDEILTDISPLWVQKIYDNREYFDKYFDLLPEFDYKTEEGYKYVLTRPEFHINKWLLKEDLNLSESESKELFKRFYDLYDNDDFYTECTPTRMAEGIYKLSLQRYVDKIYIVTRTSEGTKEGKERFLKNFFKSSKFEFIFVGQGEKKSDYIKNLGKIHMIAEDELSNIHDILDNCQNIDETDIYIPYTGYNDPTADLFDKADEKKAKLQYYPILRETEILI